MSQRHFAIMFVVACILTCAPSSHGAIQPPASRAPAPEIRGDEGFYSSPLFEVYKESFPGDQELAERISPDLPLAELVAYLGWGFEPDNFFRKMRFPDSWVRHPGEFNAVVSRAGACLLKKKELSQEVYEAYASAASGDNYQRTVAMSWLLGTGGDAARAFPIACSAFAKAKGPERRWVLASSLFWLTRYMKPEVPDAAGMLDRLVALYAAEYDPDVRLQLADCVAMLLSKYKATLVPRPEAPSCKFLGQEIQAKRLVVLVDRSGSMTDLLPLVRAELGALVRALPDDARLNIGLIGKAKPAWLAGEPAAVMDVRNRALEFLDRATIEAGAASDAGEALRAAFSWKPEQVLLVSDGELAASAFSAVDEAVKQGRACPIATFHIVYEEPGAAVMKALATRTGGTYRFVPLAYFRQAEPGKQP